MKKILLAVILTTGVIYASAYDCSNYKSKAAKYEAMGMSASNLDLGAKYLKMAIKNKKGALHACFYSHTDKMRIQSDIKDMEAMRNDMINEAANNRRQERDVARESRPNLNVEVNQQVNIGR